MNDAYRARLADRLRRPLHVGDRIPTGFFREAEGPAEDEILATWWEHARTVGGGWPAVGRILRFGRAVQIIKEGGGLVEAARALVNILRHSSSPARYWGQLRKICGLSAS